jgi:hypothetical protein
MVEIVCSPFSYAVPRCSTGLAPPLAGSPCRVARGGACRTLRGLKMSSAATRVTGVCSPQSLLFMIAYYRAFAEVHEKRSRWSRGHWRQRHLRFKPAQHVRELPRVHRTTSLGTPGRFFCFRRKTAVDGPHVVTTEGDPERALQGTKKTDACSPCSAIGPRRFQAKAISLPAPEVAMCDSYQHPQGEQ